MGADSWVLSTIRSGLRIWFTSPPPLSLHPRPVHLPVHQEKRQVLLDGIDTMLAKLALEIVPAPEDPGFYSHLFSVTKKTGGWRLVIDLKILNQYIVCPHFKMETANSIRSQLVVGQWVISVDLSDAYFHLLVHPKFRKYLRINVQGVTYQFRAMCFGLCTAPLIFTRVMKALAGYLRSQSIQIHMYLDDWLILADTSQQLLEHAQFVLDQTSRLGCLVNAEMSELVPTQLFTNLRLGTVRPTLQNRSKLRTWCQNLRLYQEITVRLFLSFLSTAQSHGRLCAVRSSVPETASILPQVILDSAR